MSTPPKVEPGDTFGSLTVIRRSERVSNNRTLWDCVCECGNLSVVGSYDLSSGRVKSCGCSRLQYKGKQSRRYTYDGRTLTLPQWAEVTGLSAKLLSRRIHDGWDLEEAFTTPSMASPKAFKTVVPEEVVVVRVADEDILSALEGGDMNTRALCEHFGLVDGESRRLLRNSLSRLCRRGSVDVVGRTSTIPSVNIYHLVEIPV